MKITLIGHASILIEVGGVIILSDPWWRGPCFGAQWWNYPLPYLEAMAGRHIDYIYISHGHHDHFHPGTLRTLNRDAKILVSRKIMLSSHVKKLGFEVIELDDDQIYTLATGVTCRVMETHAQDTLMAVTDGQEVCLNLNDALHSAPQAVQSSFIARLMQLYPTIDYVFCGYGIASHFPNCYEIPGKNREATTACRQQFFNRQWTRLIAELKPRYGFPFAADIVFLETDLFWANEPTHNAERPTDAFRALYPQSTVKTLDIAPGFVIQDGKVVQKVLRQPILAQDLRVLCRDAIERANRYGSVDEAEVKAVAALVQENLDICAEYLKSYSGDYRFLIQFRNSPWGIRVEKRGQVVSLASVRGETANTSAYDVIYTTRLPYLKRSLTTLYGDEVLFVGSGGVFEYTDQAKAKRNLHRELMQLLKKQAAPPPLRYGNSSRLIYNAKRAVKRLLRWADQDLYDLGSWTVFNGENRGQSRSSQQG
jgi:Beta-lactamase superfamily domain